jgi:hypothetical protein
MRAFQECMVDEKFLGCHTNSKHTVRKKFRGIPCKDTFVHIYQS